MKATRRGYSLVELMVLVTAMTIILGLCVGLIHSLLKLDRAGRAHVAEVATRGRLARQFRLDVRSSARAEAVPDRDGRASALRLVRPDGPAVEYRADSGRVVREERPRAGGDAPPRREAYRLRPSAAPRFEADESFVALLLPDPAPFSPPAAPREFRIDARLGADLRLSRPGGDGP